MKKITLFLFLLSLVTITSIEAQITTFPYTEDFESGDGGWVADNTENGTWALGAPTGAIINSAASGANAWVTNLSGNYNVNENSWVTSPVFDFTALAAPSIEMNIWYDIEFSWDGAVLQSSIDSGTTWVNVGANGDPNNWYTDNTIGGEPGGQQEGWSGTGTAGTNAWVTARHALTGLAGEANVIFRIAFGSDGSVVDEGFGFDDINIFEVSCPEPTAVAISNATETTADVNWTAGGTETIWNLEWGTAGFTPGTGTLETGLTATTFNLTGLTLGTSYDVYLVADCGGGSTSSLVGPITFNTAVPGVSCASAFPMTVEVECDTATPVSLDFSIAEDIDAAGENPTCDGFGNFGYWVSFTAPTIGSVIFNFGGAADGIGVEILDACGGTSLGCFNNIFDTGDSSDIIGGLTPGNTYVAVIWRDTQDGTADVCIEEGPTCTFPIDLTASNFTTDGADLAWTENGIATVWNVEVVIAGDAPTGTPTATGVTNPYSVTGLMPNTDYDFYVQADCGGGDTSDFSGPFTFRTACDVFTPDYIEQFNTITPECWSEAENGDATTGPTDLGGSQWVEDGFLNNGTTEAYKINLWLATKSDWLLSPLFDLTGGPFQVEFDFGIMEFGSTTNAGTLGSDDTVQLFITADGGTTWTSILTYDNTSVVPATGETAVVTLEAYAGQTVQFGILGSEGTVDDAEDNDVFVDNFRVRGIPTCPEPTDLTSNNLSLTETEVGWTEAGTSVLWNVEYGLAGFALGTGTVVTGVTNPTTLTGLTPDTEYDFYVQAVCDPTNLSSFAGPSSFFTGYCESEPTSNDGDGVNNVTINVTDFPSLGDVTYENQTTPIVNVFQGINTNVIIEFGHAFTYDTNIWIDFDDNLVFDATELVFQGESSGAGNPHILDASFVMPATATLGEHRMRIGTADAGQATPDPCYSGTWGVTLDFTVNIEQLTCTLPEATFVATEDCDGDQFFIDIDITSLGDATSLEISNDFDATTEVVTATGMYQAGPFPFGTTAKAFVMNIQDNNCTISSDFFTILACPPTNDDCDAATVAVVNDNGTCDMTTPGTILAATPSGVPAGTCTGNPDDDVWFEFTALSEVQIISLNNIAGGTFNLDHAVYEGDCGTLTELYCSDDDASVTPALVVGNTYYIRVFSGGAQPETSTFDLCIRAAPTNIICDNAENFCSVGGALTTPNIVGIPSDGQIACLFTAPNPVWNIIQIGDPGTIEIQINQQDAQGNGLDVDFVIWGPFDSVTEACTDIVFDDCPTCPNNTTNPDFYPFGNIVDCSYSAASVENLTIDNAIAGEIYMLLVTNFNGNAGDITIEQTNIAGTDNGTITAEIEAAITSMEVPIDPDNDPMETDEVSVCGFTSVTIETDSPFADEFIWYEDGFAIPGETGPTLTVTPAGFGLGGNNYQVQAFDNQCGTDAFSQLVIVNLYDDPGAVAPQSLVVCDGPVADGEEAFDLDQLTTDLGFGADFTVSYYTNMADANQAMNAVATPYTSSGETLIIRVEDTDAANNNFLGCRQLSEVTLTVNTNPVINQPMDFIVCDDADGTVDGVTEFNLTSIDADVTTDPNVTVTYYASQANADNNVDALMSPHSSGGETIYVRAEDNTTGCHSTTSFNLVVNVVPLATFDSQYEYEVCPNATVPVTIGITPSNFTASDVTVNWFLDSSPIAGSGLTLDTVLLQGDYSAEITFNGTGCANTISIPVMELESCIIPQGISPGVTPGQNDTFDLSSYDVVRLEIFNRNGTLVYSKNNYVNEWEGQTNDGEELPVGTYFYTMVYEGGDKTRSSYVYINR
jgi:gliding motility-associated-like protein